MSERNNSQGGSESFGVKNIKNRRMSFFGQQNEKMMKKNNQLNADIDKSSDA